MTNTIPLDPQTQQLLNSLPSSWQHYAVMAILALMILGRAATALGSGESAIMAVKSIFLGSVTTKTTPPSIPPPPPPTPPAASTAAKVGIFFLCGAFIWGAMAGCSSSQVTTAYKTEAAVDASVVAAWNMWTNYVAVANVPTNTQVQVAAAFNKVKAAELVAIDATSIAVGSTNGGIITAMLNAEGAENQALSDLGNLLATFNIKLP
jgi:uncharacterized protein YejL (UPF0352 family)